MLRGRCLDYGQGITFWPVAEILRQAVGASEQDSPDTLRRGLERLLDGSGRQAALAVERLGSLLGLTEAPIPADELRWAMRKLVEIMARRQPLLLVIDDLHWAEPALVDLVEHLADWTRDAPVLLCCMARSEFLEGRPGWGGGKRNATTVSLEPLTTEESAKLVDELLGPASVPTTVRRQVIEVAGGNPLFVEEIAAMLLQAGQPELGPASDPRRVVAIEIPSTITALLAARLDQLTPGDRELLEWASVIGERFTAAELRALLPDRDPRQIERQLLALLRQDLICPDPSADEDFRFRHQLIRDAAYARLPKRQRAVLHQRFADHRTAAVGSGWPSTRRSSATTWSRQSGTC